MLFWHINNMDSLENTELIQDSYYLEMTPKRFIMSFKILMWLLWSLRKGLRRNETQNMTSDDTDQTCWCDYITANKPPHGECIVAHVTRQDQVAPASNSASLMVPQGFNKSLRERRSNRAQLLISGLLDTGIRHLICFISLGRNK